MPCAPNGLSIVIHLSIRIPLAFLTLLSPPSFAGTADPSGVAELILITIFVAPLIVLVLIGAASGGIRGVAIGAVIYLVGLASFMYPAHQRSQQNLVEYNKESEIWSEACLREAGETGKPLPFPIDKVLVHIDPLLEKSWFAPKYAGTDSAPWTQFIASIPERLAPGEALVDIRLIDRNIEGAGTRRLQGVETEIRDSAGKFRGKRTNFIRVSDSCLAEREDHAVERFLRRTLGIQSVLYSSVKPDQLIATEYPIGKLFAPENGIFVPNPAIRVGKLKTIVPSEWGCKFDKNVGGPDLIKCPDPANNPVRDQTLQGATAVYDAGTTWLVLVDPALTNGVNNGFLDRAVVELRDRNGQPLKHLVVRFPRIQGTRTFKLADVQILPDRVELFLLTKVCRDPQDRMKSQHCERIRLSVPLREIGEY